jgi:LuxR family maltose regulon positive regulatory protein
LQHTYPELILRATPPRISKLMLQRPRLSASLMDARDKAVIILQAPSGYGKTSLLVHWRKEWMSSGELVAWLTLDERDDSENFIRGLGVAMDIAVGKAHFEQAMEQWISRRKNELDALTNWLVEVADIGRDTVLILDDFHLFTEKIGSIVIEYLIHNAPSNLRIVISARDTAMLDVCDFVAIDQYAVVESNALRFSKEESIGLLAMWSNARMSVVDAEYLHEFTGGWPLGLQLVMSSIGKHGNMKQAVASVSATSGNIERYFIDFLLVRMAPETATFLIHISALETVCPSLCVAATKNEQAEYYLQTLRKSTPIFIEVKGPWLRMHPLVREFLRSRWQLLPPQERVPIHENAARWLAAHAMYEEAAHHAMQANQNEQAYSFIEQCLYEITACGQFGRVLSWLDKLPAEEVARRPRLRLAAAWTLAMGKRHAEAESLVRQILAQSQEQPDEQCECEAILAVAAYHADRIDEAASILAPWFDVLPLGSVRMSAIILGQKSLFYLYQGKPEAARYFLSKAATDHDGQLAYAVKGFFIWVTGLSYQWEGQFIIAEKFLRENLQLAEQEVGRNSSITVSLAMSLAAVLLELGQAEHARAIMSYRLEFIERNCSPEVIGQAYLTAARLLLASGEEAQAHEVLRELCVIGEMREIPRLVLLGLADRIRLHAIKEQAFTCVELEQTLNVVAGSSAQLKSGLVQPLLYLIIMIAHAYVALAQRNWHKMIDILAQAPVLLDQLHRGRERVQVMFLLALASLQIGGSSEAALAEAFSLAEMYGLRQLAQEFLPLLGAWGRDHDVSSQAHAAAATPSATQPPASAYASSHPGRSVHSSMLTPREHQILLLLSRHMTNKEIGNTVSISEETVKWHLKNIYGKLQAGTRKHVVTRAKMLGLIE